MATLSVALSCAGVRCLWPEGWLTKMTGFFDCLVASVAAVQAEDVRASFSFVGDLNGHHQE